MKYLDCCIIAMRACYKECRLVDQMLIKQYHHGNVYSGQVDLAYDKYVTSITCRDTVHKLKLKVVLPHLSYSQIIQIN